MYKDPVCGMAFETSEFQCEFNGGKYYFCSEGCLNKFLESKNQQPEKRIYDLIIIGGGPSGLTAAVYASISKLNTFLIASDIGGQAVDSAKIKNYMGFDSSQEKSLLKNLKINF